MDRKEIVEMAQKASIKSPISCFGLFAEPFNKYDVCMIVLCLFFKKNLDKKEKEVKSKFEEKLQEYKRDREDTKKAEKIVQDLIDDIVTIPDTINQLLSIVFSLLSFIDISILGEIIPIIIPCGSNKDKKQEIDWDEIKASIDKIEEQSKSNFDALKEMVEKQAQELEKLAQEIKKKDNSGLSGPGR